MKAIRKIARTVAVLVGVAGFSGCGRESPPSMPAPASKESSTAPVPNAAKATNLPGVFVAKGIRLELLADGRYRMRVHAESAKSDLDSEGQWSVWDLGYRLHLQPDYSSEPVRDYTLLSADALESHDHGQTLRREGKR